MNDPRKHVMAVIGTRPEAVKMAPVVAELRRRPQFRCTLVSAGQHREMLYQALSSFGLDVDMDLAIMQPDQTLASLTAAVVQACDRVICEQEPDVVLVQGDTTTVMATALAAFYRRVPVGHVEAGLRTHEPYNPFPEEMNRSLVGRLASLHFAPTDLAASHLVREGVCEGRIHVTGNTVVDAIEAIRGRLDETPPSETVRQAVAQSAGRLVLVTCHRRESFGSDLSTIVESLRALADMFPERLFFFPVHLNPNVRRQVMPRLAGIDNIVLADPIAYRDMLHCLEHAELVLTDSGGLQEEAPSFRAPCIVLRRTTERPEGVNAGFARLAPMEQESIVNLAAEWLRTDYRSRLSGMANPYGDGKAAVRIVDILAREFPV